MDAFLKRMWFLKDCCIGEFFLDDQFICYMLEDPPREPGVKIAKRTGIPFGLAYKIGQVFSPKFEKIVPIIYTEIVGKGNTPGDYIIKDPHGTSWAAVEIHSGNSAEDSDACQLPGLRMDAVNQVVLDSKKARDIVYDKIFAALDSGEQIGYTIIHTTPDQAHDAVKTIAENKKHIPFDESLQFPDNGT